MAIVPIASWCIATEAGFGLAEEASFGLATEACFGMTKTRIRGILIDLNREHVAVMRAVAQGLSYREIADQLCLSERTVYRRIKAVCEALGAVNVQEAQTLLIQAGIVGTDEP